MAARKKAKAKRKKAPARKAPAARKAAPVRKKAAKKKAAKKAPARRAAPRKAAPPKKSVVAKQPAAPRPTAVAKPRAARPPAVKVLGPLPPASALPRSGAGAGPVEERVGVVTHYFTHLSVASVWLESGTLSVGDMVRISGHTSEFRQRVESIQVEHQDATEVTAGQEFGLKVNEHAREHDVVYKVIER
jgi:hypothetical protein